MKGKESEKEAEVMFSNEVSGDLLTQLKDGTIIFYYFRDDPSLQIYNGKTFQKLIEIDLELPIKKYIKEKQNKNKNNEDKSDNKETLIEEDYEYYPRYNYKKGNISIKELNNGVILIGISHYLIQTKSVLNIEEYKVVTELNENILNINELPNNKIIIITTNAINVFNASNNEYIKASKYPIKDNWRIESVSSTSRWYGEFNQYFSSYILPNDRLLLNSFSTEMDYNGGCGTHPPREFSFSKIVFIDTKNFEEIGITKTFHNAAKYLVLENVIVFQTYKNIIIYDINSFKIIKEIEGRQNFDYFYRYDDQYLIGISKLERQNDLYIYKLDNNEIFEYCVIKVKNTFDEIRGWNHYAVRGFNNKFLYTLKDKRIVIICHDKLYLLKINLD